LRITDDGNDDDAKKTKEKKKKAKKAKAKTAQSEMGGTGQYADKTYGDICKEDIAWVTALINSKEQLSNEEEEFVDWCLNKEDGRACYAKWKAKGGGGGGCMPGACVLM